MTRYLTSYRYFVLGKLGLGLAYLWFCWDFLRINLALHDELNKLLPDLATERIFDDLFLNDATLRVLSLLSHPVLIWIYLAV